MIAIDMVLFVPKARITAGTRPNTGKLLKAYARGIVANRTGGRRAYAIAIEKAAVAPIAKPRDAFNSVAAIADWIRPKFSKNDRRIWVGRGMITSRLANPSRARPWLSCCSTSCQAARSSTRRPTVAMMRQPLRRRSMTLSQEAADLRDTV